MKPNNEQIFSAQLSAEMAQRTDKLGKEHIDLALQVKQAREFLEWSTHHMRQTWLDWMAESNKVSQDVTALRMLLDREGKSILASGKDVKEFFNSGEYCTAHQRMLDMITILQRFKEMKADGTLDAFADFILKVSCGNK